MNSIGNDRKWRRLRSAAALAASLGLTFAFERPANATDSLCATVKIEIQQELTFERQAFDAHMRINNGLSTIALENVGVVVTFADTEGNTVSATSAPNNTNALFFIRIDTMENIGNVSGSGSVAPSTSADVHWLIVPAFGAGGAGASGVRYLVGARLTYRIGGETNVMDVVPDSILVKPMPRLELDYFLPGEVYGDDTFTVPVEPPVPFSLGVRVRNSGGGVARSVRIESAQPKIVENALGLLIGFNIAGSEVNGAQVSDSLLVNFGDIQPYRSGVARWVMTATLSGRFAEFTANYTHADELGGQLTSLFSTNGVQTHFLVQDVLVDLPGRDGIRDFLANDGDGLKVYESENTDSSVTDQSGSAALSGTNARYTLSTAPSSGFSYLKLTDPLAGAQTLRSATRADGKALSAANAWLSKTQDRNTHLWNYFVNVFDVNNTAGLAYTLEFAPGTGQTNRPPVLDPISSWTINAGEFVAFPITASDPDGNSLTFSFVSTPPTGATLDGVSGLFQWHPAAMQVPSTNVIRVRVSDNGTPSLSATASFTVIVHDNAAPALAGIPDYSANVLQTLTFTNVATDPEQPPNALSFALDATAPAGASVNPTNGIFQWTPSRDQAPSTNLITVTVTDDGVPPRSDSKSFSVIVNDFLELKLGSAVLAVGDSGNIAVSLYSSTPLTNLEFAVDFPASRFRDWFPQPPAPLSASALLLSSNQLFLSYAPPFGQSLLRTQQLGQLSLTVVSNQPSAFVRIPLVLTRVKGVRADGTAVSWNLLGDGEIVTVGKQSLLRAALGADGQRSLTLYGQPGTNYVIEFTFSLVPPVLWQNFGSVVLTNLAQPVGNAGNTNSEIYYRAWQ